MRYPNPYRRSALRVLADIGLSFIVAALAVVAWSTAFYLYAF